MKKITIIQSQNGWLAVHGELPTMFDIRVENTYTFNSLDRAIEHIRRRMRDMHPIKPKSNPAPNNNPTK